MPCVCGAPSCLPVMSGCSYKPENPSWLSKPQIPQEGPTLTVLKGEWGAEDMGRDLEGLGKAVQNLCAESGGEQEA